LFLKFLQAYKKKDILSIPVITQIYFANENENDSQINIVMLQEKINFPFNL